MEWPLWILAAAGLGALFGLLQIHPATKQHVHVTRDMRIVWDARLGTLALVFGIVMLLATATAGRRMAERRKDREARREARRATLIKHADPVTAQVENNGQRIEEIAADLRTTKMTYDGVVGALGSYLAQHGFNVAEDLQKTTEMPARPDLYLAAKDGERLSEEGRDSA